MTFHGLGALNTTAQNMQRIADTECGDWTPSPELDAVEAQYLAGCFIRVPPPGVPQDIHDRFCLRAVQCQAFSRPGDFSVDEYLFQNAPIADCLSDDYVRVLDYWTKHNYYGSDPAMNMLVWLGSRGPGYWDRLTMQTPPCDKACIDDYRASVIMRCLSQMDSPCARSNAVQAWFDANVDRQICSAKRQEIQAEVAQMSCGDLVSLLDYCEQYGRSGPEPVMNAMCWALVASGAFSAARARCPSAAQPPSPTSPAPYPAPAPYPEPTAEEPSMIPSLAPADMTSYPTETGPAPVFAPPVIISDEPGAPPAPRAGMKTSTMVTLGVLAAVGITGAVLIAKRSRR
jgi:hypothetical protein